MGGQAVIRLHSFKGLTTVVVMDVFLMVRRKTTSVFLDAKESSTVLDVKRMLNGILKKAPEDMRLLREDNILEDGKTLGEAGLTSATAKPQEPATLGLTLRDGDDFEPLEIAELSIPPELPDVMKQQESSTAAHPEPA